MRPGSLSLWERGTAKRWSGWRRYDITHTDTFPSKERPTFDENVVSICYVLPPTPFPPLTRSPFPVGEGCCTRNLRQQMKRFHLSQKKIGTSVMRGTSQPCPFGGMGRCEVPPTQKSRWCLGNFGNLRCFKNWNLFHACEAIRSGNRPSCGGCDGSSACSM